MKNPSARGAINTLDVAIAIKLAPHVIEKNLKRLVGLEIKNKTVGSIENGAKPSKVFGP